MQRGIYLLNQEFNARSNYENVMIKSNSWKVRMLPNLDETRCSSIYRVHPIYSRVRTVTVQQSRMKCSCQYFERTGLICRHMFNVMANFIHYKGPSHHDISVHWWANYYKSGCSNTTLSQGFDKLYDNDVSGPYINPIHYDQCNRALILSDTKWHRNPNIPKVVNIKISTSQTLKLLELTSIPVGCSQISSYSHDKHDMDMSVNSVTEVQDIEDNEIMSHDLIGNNNVEFQLNQSNFDDGDLRKTSNAFDFLYPSFKEMCGLADGVCDKKRLLHIKEWIDNESLQIMKLSVEQCKKRKQNVDTGTYVSSTIPNSTKQKTHGNKL